MDPNPYKSTESHVSVESKKTGNRFARFLKKVLLGFGVVFLLLIVLLVWGGLSTSKTHSKFENRVNPFIEGFLASQDPWNYETAKPHLSKEWLAATSDEQGEKLFNVFRKLGKLNSIQEISWVGCMSGTDAERCNYRLMASYEKGDAEILFGVSIEEDELKVVQLRVNSDVFLD